MYEKLSKVVLDIETVGKDLKDLDEDSQEYIEKQARRQGYNEEETEMKTSISPLTAEVVVIGMYNPDTHKGKIYYQSKKKEKDYTKNNIKFIVGTEKEILEHFWEDVVNYRSIITFNGRNFDVPFINIRSAVNKVKIAKNLLPPRYSSTPVHIDLLDQMTYFQPWKGMSTLHFFCKAFGIQTPKDGEVNGYSVKEYFKKGACKEIAEYNLKDLKATAELYEYWAKYLN